MADTKEQAWRWPDGLDRFAVSTDPLSQVTDQVRLSNLFCGVIRVTPPFAQTAAVDGFHVLLMAHGEMYVEAVGAAQFAPVLLVAGDALVMPRGIPYRLLYPLGVSGELDVNLTHIEDASKPQAKDVEFLGMICYLDRAHRNLLTDFLPPVMHLKKRTPGLTRWLKRTVELFRAEYGARSPGRSSILSRLAEIVCVQALRIWIEQIPPDMKGWVQGLKDERIALALQAIHKHPGRRWTVASLAHHAGMSRTVFATRFKALAGESPMEYVSRWRMHRAVGLLEEGADSLKSVVEASGYKSASTFRVNFKRRFGMLPSDYRGRDRPQTSAGKRNKPRRKP